MTKDRLSPLAEYVDSELAYEWQRKASLETRGFAFITANLGFVTLFLALSADDEFADYIATGTPFDLVRASLGLVILSIACAVLSGVPSNYSAPALDALHGLYARALEGSISVDDLASEITEARIVQLGSARRSNGWKALFTLMSFVALSIAFVCLSIAVIPSLR